MNYKELQKRNSKFKLELKSKATKEELIFKQFLDDNKIKYIFQKGFFYPFHRICDFYIKKYRLIVEIDGGYHLNTKEKDERKDRLWRRFHTLRILNEQVNDGSYSEIFDKFISYHK